MRLVFDIVDPRQKDPNRGHRRCEGDPGLDVQALSPRGRKSELSGALLHVGDQRRLADPGVSGNQYDLRLSLAGERESVVQLAALRLTTNDLNSCSSDHGALLRPIVLHRHRAVTPPRIRKRPARRNSAMLRLQLRRVGRRTGRSLLVLGECGSGLLGRLRHAMRFSGWWAPNGPHLSCLPQRASQRFGKAETGEHEGRPLPLLQHLPRRSVRQ